MQDNKYKGMRRKWNDIARENQKRKTNIYQELEVVSLPAESRKYRKQERNKEQTILQ